MTYYKIEEKFGEFPWAVPKLNTQTGSAVGKNQFATREAAVAALKVLYTLDYQTALFRIKKVTVEDDYWTVGFHHPPELLPRYTTHEARKSAGCVFGTREDALDAVTKTYQEFRHNSKYLFGPVLVKGSGEVTEEVL